MSYSNGWFTGRPGADASIGAQLKRASGSQMSRSVHQMYVVLSRLTSSKRVALASSSPGAALFITALH